MSQHSFQPRPYDENSRVWHNDHKPQFNLMGCICFILFLASCFWVIRAIDKSPRAFIWFLLFMYFLLWLCSRPVKRPRNILAVCDNEGLTLYDHNETILHQWRWQDIAKINVLAAAGHSRLAVQDQAGKSAIMDENQLPPDVMQEITFDVMMRIQGDNYLTQIPLPQIIPEAQEMTVLIQTAPATLSLTKEAAPENRKKTITPHTWYMNATVVREANHNINETVAIFMLTPVFLLFFRDMAQGVVAAFGMAVCFTGALYTAYHCLNIYRHIFGRRRMRYFAQADEVALTLYPFAEDEFRITWAAMRTCEYIKIPPERTPSSYLLITDKQGEKYRFTEDKLGSDEVLSEIALYAQAVLRGAPVALEAEDANAHPKRTAYISVWLSLSVPFAFMLALLLGMYGFGAAICFIAVLLGMATADVDS